MSLFLRVMQPWFYEVVDYFIWSIFLCLWAEFRRNPTIFKTNLFGPVTQFSTWFTAMWFDFFKHAIKTKIEMVYYHSKCDRCEPKLEPNSENFNDIFDRKFGNYWKVFEVNKTTTLTTIVALFRVVWVCDCVVFLLVSPRNANVFA